MERSKLQFQVVINGKKELDDIFKLVKQIQEKNKFKSIKNKIDEIAVTKADKDEDRNISANRRQFIENNKEMYEYFRKQKIS